MPEVIHYPERRRFQIDINGLEAGYISYTEHNGGWDVDHTEVSPNFRKSGHRPNAGGCVNGICRSTRHPAHRKLRLRGAVYRLTTYHSETK